MSLMLSAFVDAVKKAASAPETAAAATALSRLAALFGLAELQDGQQWSGLLDLEQMQLAEQVTISVTYLSMLIYRRFSKFICHIY
eukprot:SAG31_NODE_733_length_12491_cov_7.073112_13_plen_85_part_00